MMYKRVISIGDSNKTMVMINHKESEQKIEEISVTQLHHIHILDRSGSMYGNMEELIQNVKDTLKVIDKNDYVSIIWFSGPGQYKTLIKGARGADNLDSLLDSIRSTVGCTCFSEALQEAGEIINDLKTLCENFSITLFTDGCPVVPWSEEEEKQRMMEHVRNFGEYALALNTIGYGNYYNQELMKSISELTPFGQFIHSSKIGEYSSVFSHNYNKVSEMSVDSLKVTPDDGTEIVYVTSKMTRGYDGSINLRLLDKRKNQVLLIGDGDFTFDYNGKMYNSTDVSRKISDSQLTPALYAYANHLYYKGKRFDALKLMALVLKDKGLADLMHNSFTFDEVAHTQEKIESAVFSASARLTEGVCEKDYLPADDVFCLMDLLDIIVENPGNYYEYSREYNRIGLKVTDKYDLFEYKDEPILTPINSLVMNKTALNVSIMSVIKGSVELNPKQATRVGLPSTVDCVRYKNQTIIKDGDVNIKDLKLKLTHETFSKIIEADKDGSLEYVDDFKDGVHNITIRTDSIPVINRKMIDSGCNVDDILENVKIIKVEEATQKVVNHLISLDKKLAELEGLDAFKGYTITQTEVLKDHGLNERMEYVGVDREKAEKNEDDYYISRTLAFDLAGMSSLPSLDAVIKKSDANKELKLTEKVMVNIYEELKGATSEELTKAKEDAKYSLMKYRLQQCRMKMAVVLSGSWFEGLTVDKKGNYTYDKDEYTLIIKPDRVKNYY